MRRTATATATAVALAVGSASCIAVLGLDKLSEKSDGGTMFDAAFADAGEADAEAGVCPSDSIDVPSQPTVPGAPVRDPGASLFFAFKVLDLGLPRGADAGAALDGYDLDHQNTTELASNSCVVPAGDPELQKKYVIDGEGGADGASVELMQLIGSFAASLRPTIINTRLQEGYFGMVLRIDQWNGGTDDDVFVHAFPAIGLWEQMDGGLVPRVPGPMIPLHRGDRWMLDERFAFSDGSKVLSVRAWVKNGVLVAQFPTFTLPLRSSLGELMPFDVRLRDAWITAKLTWNAADGTGSLDNGMLVGRAALGDFLSDMRFLSVDAAKEPTRHICDEDREHFEIVSQAACLLRDIRSSHCDDGRNLPCDAISFAARFETYQVDRGGPMRRLVKDDYVDAGLLPPEERCNAPNAIDGGVNCP